MTVTIAAAKRVAIHLLSAWLSWSQPSPCETLLTGLSRTPPSSDSAVIFFWLCCPFPKPSVSSAQRLHLLTQNLHLPSHLPLTFLFLTEQAAHFQVLSTLPSERVQHLTSMAARHLCLDYPSLGCRHLSPALSQWPCCRGSWLLSLPAYRSLSTQEPQGSLPPLLRNFRAATSHADMVPYDQVPWHLFGFISHYLPPFLTQLQPHWPFSCFNIYLFICHAGSLVVACGIYSLAWDRTQAPYVGRVES